jgi:CDP-diacylglycerol--inositol 3-phosphatidyltransferase
MVFWYVPNVIGYLRVLFLLPLVVFPFENIVLNSVCYGVSQALDGFDGMAARHFNQASRFGAVLDMVTDRASNALLLGVLGALYPGLAWLFYGDLVLDLVSHWYHMYASLAAGKHHKEAQPRFRLLALYYGSKAVLAGLVFGNELFLVSMYLRRGHPHWLLDLLAGAGALLFAVKKVMSAVQLADASLKLAEMDRRGD